MIPDCRRGKNNETTQGTDECESEGGNNEERDAVGIERSQTRGAISYKT